MEHKGFLGIIKKKKFRILIDEFEKEYNCCNDYGKQLLEDDLRLSLKYFVLISELKGLKGNIRRLLYSKE